jgi:hypothetical protein
MKSFRVILVLATTAAGVTCCLCHAWVPAMALAVVAALLMLFDIRKALDEMEDWRE